MNMDKNGKEIKTGHIVKIEGGFFKADNGTFLVKHAPGDPSWSGSDYCLTKCNKKGVESEAKYATAFWPLMITVSSSEKRIAAKQHNKEHATIEIIGSVKVYELNVKQTRGWNDYETREIATEKRYQELLTYKYTKVEIVSESTNDQKAELPVPVSVEEVAPVEVVEVEPVVTEEPTPSIATVEAIAPTTTIQGTSLIDESLAKRSKENMSFSDYKTGSATAEFNQEIAGVRTAIEKAKLKVSEEAQAKLDRLLASHTSRYAAWTNKRNANGASHVSVMLAGPSNYNMSKHNKYLAKEGKLWAEYDEFKDIYNRINAIVAGDKIIKSNDANAIDKLKDKLANAQARKDGTQPHMPYVMSNSNGRIKGIKDRIAHLERLAAQESKEIVVETESEESNRIRIVDNVEAHRLQIFFNGKPSAEVRTKLKKNGFRWTPSISAWQSYRSDHATRAAQEIVSSM